MKTYLYDDGVAVLREEEEEEKEEKIYISGGGRKALQWAERALLQGYSTAAHGRLSEQASWPGISPSACLSLPSLLLLLCSPTIYKSDRESEEEHLTPPQRGKRRKMFMPTLCICAEMREERKAKS